MLITRTFIHAKDQDSGDDGWKPAKIPEFNAGSGYHVAHDTLEHFEDTNVGFNAEMRAMGTTLFGRGEGFYWSQLESFDASLSVRLRVDFTGFIAASGHELTDPGKTKPLSPYLEDALMGLRHWAQSARRSFPDGQKVSEKELDKRIEWAFGWIRRGYREAKAKYKGTSQHDLAALFIKIVTDVDALDESTLYIGDILTVTVDTEALTVHLEVDHAGQRAKKRKHRVKSESGFSFADIIRSIDGIGPHAADIARAVR